MAAGVPTPQASAVARTAHPQAPEGEGAGFAASLAVTVTLAGGFFLALMSALLLVVHPPGSGSLATDLIIQNQSAKTFLYVTAFAVVLPVAVFAVPRRLDRIAAVAPPGAVSALAAAMVAADAAVLIAVRLSALAPWGDGLGTLLVGELLWLVWAGAVLARAGSAGLREPLARLARAQSATAVLAGALVLGVLLCTTRLAGLGAEALGLGAIAAVIILGVATLATRGGLRLRAPVLLGGAWDVAAVVLLLLSACDLVVFQVSGGLPNAYFPPGVIQFQQDWILGPANQLLGGGAVLVNVPASQYGVGLLYFVAAWFHLAPIGYGTFGLLDGLLTGLVYIVAYSVLRIAGVGRLLAAAAMALAVVVLLYNQPYSVGALPEEGPLRFGLPIVLVSASVLGARWPHRARAAHLAALVALAVSSIWALEAFGYTALTFAAVSLTRWWLLGGQRPRRWLLRPAGLAVVAILCAHLLLASVTLAVTGRLPDWTQYLAYLRALLLGGKEGSITYGFSPWPPGLAVAGAEFASAAGVVLLARRAPALARAHPAALIALAGSTAYAIASFSYIDNRSSTYLLLFTSLPLLIAGVLWLSLLLGEGPPLIRLGGLGFALALSVVLLAAAWPAIAPRFSRSALAHLPPGGGLAAAVSRLWHPPPVDPRAPEGQRLVDRFLPGRHVLILLPSSPDLGIEIAMRARRFNALFIGDPSQDVFVSSVWLPRIRAEIAHLRPGARALVDETALRDVRRLRDRPADYVLRHARAGSSAQLQWILDGLDRRFALRPIRRAARGLVVVQLDRRR
ncbi:MAG: hypothetical protein QOF83_3943 [Solirubrobacteraceae bacterium]|nr:hypothetical protein [Solirubrobacteraceae bacterium]